MQDASYGLRGVRLTDPSLVDMAGAIESCPKQQMEGAPLPAAFDARDEHAKCFASGFIVDAKNCSTATLWPPRGRSVCASASPTQAKMWSCYLRNRF
jgi:hypothetical protein